MGAHFPISALLAVALFILATCGCRCWTIAAIICTLRASPLPIYAFVLIAEHSSCSELWSQLCCSLRSRLCNQLCSQLYSERFVSEHGNPYEEKKVEASSEVWTAWTMKSQRTAAFVQKRQYGFAASPGRR